MIIDSCNRLYIIFSIEWFKRKDFTVSALVSLFVTIIFIVKRDTLGHMTRILITGAMGQIGTELTELLARKYGKSSVVVSDIRKPEHIQDEYEFVELDVTDNERIAEVMKEYSITDIFHMAAILSATGEKYPDKAFWVNSNGTFNILNRALEYGANRVIIPSTIGVFGNETPVENTPDITILRPRTMYGITKVNAELLSLYYRDKLGLDVRGLRYPGIISYLTPPSAGTTDYAVDIFYHAVKGKDYTCYLKEDTRLPMMYMPDALDSLVKLFEADRKRLTNCLEYNIQSYSFSPAELYSLIKEEIPSFRIRYDPDYRQKIAETWPKSVDSSAAVRDWDFKPSYDLKATVQDMILNLSKILAPA